MSRLFVLEKGKIISVRDDAGTEISFPSIANFNAYYPGLDLSGKNKINYEPVTGFFIDDSMVDNRIPVEDYPAYEAVIAQAADLAADLADLYFGLDLDQAKALKKSLLKEEARDTFDARYEWLDLVEYIVNPAVDPAPVKADYDAVLAAYFAARNQVNAVPDTGDLAADIAAVKAVTANWPSL